MLEQESLNILCLGIGGCVLEYPLIQGFAAGGRKVSVYGVDKSKFALAISSQIVSKNRWDIKTIEDYLPLLERSEKLPKHSCLLHGDLNQPRPWIQKNEISGNGWLHNLRTRKWPKQFDLIFMSGCLHHLSWWKTAACAAFDLLKPNGLLMIPKIEGSFRCLDGTFDTRKPDPLHATLSPFWSKRLIAEAKRVVGTSQAIEPVEIQEFLGLLFTKELAEDEYAVDARYSYDFFNLLSHERLHFLMENRAFSTLRRISREIGKDNYHIAIRELLKQESENYKVNTEVTWRIWQKPPTAVPRTHSFLRKFIGSTSINCEKLLSYLPQWVTSPITKHFMRR